MSLWSASTGCKKLQSFGFQNPIDKIQNEVASMPTLRETAKEYEDKTTKNISDLKEVSTEIDTETREYTKSDGEMFKIEVIVVDDVDYRVPASVKKQLKVLLEDKPDATKFKVKKTGSGMKTNYQVILLD